MTEQSIVQIPLVSEEPQPFEETVVRVYRCTKVVKGGRRFSFGALVVVGNRSGQVGIGYGKANEVPAAVEKAVKDAKKKLYTVSLKGRSLPHRVKKPEPYNGKGIRYQGEHVRRKVGKALAGTKA